MYNNLNHKINNMGVTREELEKLKAPMDYKFRVQSAKYGKATGHE